MIFQIAANRCIKIYTCCFIIYVFSLYYLIEEVEEHTSRNQRNHIDKSLSKNSTPKEKEILIIRQLSDLPKNGSVWPIVVMSTKGRLGNALFEYALGLIVQKLYPDALVGVAENVQKMVQKVLEPETLVFPVISERFIKQNEYMFEHNEPDYMKGDMDSFFLPRIQNGVEIFRKNKMLSIIGMEAFPYKILSKHQDYIRDKMRLMKINLNKATKYIHDLLLQRYGEITNELKEQVVAFHIRRKDYLLFSALFHKHGLPGKEYYEKAINFYKRRLKSPTFIVFTDDVTHARQALMDYQDVVIKDTGTEEEDMSLIASCKYVILTIGTFGFFSAMLANAEVVYPVFLNQKPSQFANDTSIPTWKVVNYEEENFGHFYGLVV